MAAPFQTSVITPEGAVFEGPAEFVAVPAIDGEVGILHNRAPLLAMLGAGRLRVESSGNKQEWFVSGGFAQVLDNHAIILTQEAVPRDKIDTTKAQKQLDEARAMKPTDDLAAKRKAHLEASARAQLHLAMTH
jgi:F-type H+-transporting ATPase subunit epsilon